MQHEDRECFVEQITNSLIRDLLPETKKRICDNPYKPYNPDVILDLMGKYSIQRRTAREWLICAQIRLANQLKDKPQPL